MPGLGGLATPPIFGALSVGVHGDVYSLMILFAIGAFSVIFGFVLNDYADVELDKLIKDLKGKPLVDGVIERRTAVFICFFCVLLAFFFLFLLWRGKTLDLLKGALDKNLERLVPDFRSHLRWAIYPAVWHLNGVAKTIENVKPEIQTPMKNLFLIGDCVKAPGIGMNCAINSARVLQEMLSTST